MKEVDFEECLKNNVARRITADIMRAKSLREIAKERIQLISEINEKNCNFVFEDYYTSMLEILQALAFEWGYNILNHLCLGYFLRDVLKKEELFRIFDDLRYKRNSLTYYGVRMELTVCKKAVEDCKRLIKELEKEKV